MTDDSEFPGQWVRVMNDYCSDGVWARDGSAISLDDLPISEPLRERIRIWQSRFDRERDAPGFDMPGHSVAGLEIARAVKGELPLWTVIYFDEARSQAALTRSEFEYEV